MALCCCRLHPLTPAARPQPGRSPAAPRLPRPAHLPVRQVECLLHTVPVVHVDVDVQHPRVVLEELEDGEHEVVDVAEARGLALLGVVQAARPVDGDVVRAVVELDGALDGGARV